MYTNQSNVKNDNFQSPPFTTKFDPQFQNTSRSFVSPPSNQDNNFKKIQNFTQSQMNINNQSQMHGSIIKSAYIHDMNSPQELAQAFKQKDIEKLKIAKNHCKACEAKYQEYSYLFQAQTKIVPTNIDVNQVLLSAKSFIQKRFYDKADIILTNACRQGLEHADAYYLLGETKRLQGLNREAEESLLKCLNFDVYSPYAYYSLGLIYIELGQYKRAIPLLEKFIEYLQSNDALFELGKCHVKENQFLESAQAFSKAIQINECISIYYLHRGDAYEALGFQELAKNDFQKFKQMEPNFFQEYEQQALQLEMQGLFQEAANLRQYATNINNA